MNNEDRLQFLHELMNYDYNLFTWEYDANGNLLSSNCHKENLLETIFLKSGCKDYMLEYARYNAMPLIMSSNTGLIWLAVFERTDILYKIHILGPAFMVEISESSLQKLMHQFKGEFNIAWRNEFIGTIKALPVISHSHLTKYATLLHYVVADERITVSDLSYQHTPSEHESINKDDIIKEQEIRSSQHIEDALLKMVENGDLNYKEALNNAITFGNGLIGHVGDSLQQTKNSVFMFISLCARAAVEGGLSREGARAIEEFYIQNIENCQTISEAAVISNTMYEDYIMRVHKCKISNLSKPIQNCCEYIELHVEEKLSISEIAEKIGYSTYYLTRKFKDEVGYSIVDYIKKSKIERAKLMLSQTQQSIPSISNALNFCTRSYFDEVFHQITNLSPAEYRKKYYSI